MPKPIPAKRYRTRPPSRSIGYALEVAREPWAFPIDVRRAAIADLLAGGYRNIANELATMLDLPHTQRPDSTPRPSMQTGAEPDRQRDLFPTHPRSPVASIKLKD